MWKYTNQDELYHYGVIGMKWGIHRAAKKGATYTYKSHGTKKYEKKAARASAKGNIQKAKKYESYAERSRQLDKGMQDYAKTVGKGKAAVQAMTTWSKTYAATKVATGNTKIVSRGLGFAVNYLAGPFGASLVRASYVREPGVYDNAKKISENIDRKISKNIDRYLLRQRS